MYQISALFIRDSIAKGLRIMTTPYTELARKADAVESLLVLQGMLQKAEAQSETGKPHLGRLDMLEQRSEELIRDCKSIETRLKSVNSQIDRKFLQLNLLLASATSTPIKVDIWAEKVNAKVTEQVDPEAVIACDHVRNWIRVQLSSRCIEKLKVYGEPDECEFFIKGFWPGKGFDTVVVRFKSNVPSAGAAQAIETLLFLNDNQVKNSKLGYAESRHFNTKELFETEIYRLFRI